MPKRPAKAEPSPLPEEGPAAGRPPRPTKAQVDAERYPHLDRHPMLKRALVLLRAMGSGKSRAEAEAMADEKVGPRAPRWQARQAKPTARGRRPEPERRVRVKAVRRKAAGPGPRRDR